MRSRLLSAPTAFGRIGFASAGKVIPQIVKILRTSDTSWTVPRTSLYTIYAYGPGSQNLGGPFSRKQIRLTQGAVYTLDIQAGGYMLGNSFIQPNQTTMTGPNVSITLPGNGNNPTGGDFNVKGTSTLSGGDGSFWGSYQGVAATPDNPKFGITPGGPGVVQGTNGYGGDSEIRIVDEEPAS